MGTNTTMVLVDTFQVLDAEDLSKRNYDTAVSQLIKYFTEDYCTLISAEPQNINESKLGEATIGFCDPERLISQVEKYHNQNLVDAKAKLEAAEYLFKKHKTTLTFMLNPNNFDIAIKPEYINSYWKVTDCLNILSGRESYDLSFYDLTDSSSRISEHQMKSIKENPGGYALIPITYKT